MSLFEEDQVTVLFEALEGAMVGVKTFAEPFFNFNVVLSKDTPVTLTVSSVTVTAMVFLMEGLSFEERVMVAVP